MSSLVIDVGGTFVKAGMVDGSGRLVGVTRRTIPGFLPTGFERGAREIDPEQLIQAAQDALADVVPASNADLPIRVAGQMAGLAFVNHEGRAVQPLIAWQDTRFKDVSGLENALSPCTLEDLGDGLRVGSPAVMLREMEIPAGVFVTSLLGFVAGQLVGVRADTIHSTDAGAWGLLDTRRMSWSLEALEVLGVNPDALPRVTTDPQVRVTGSRVHVPLGDQQAALWGAELAPGELSVNLATGCQVSVLADDFSTAVQTRPYLDSRYLHTVTHLPGGRLMGAAVHEAAGDRSESAWRWAASEGLRDSRISEAMSIIVGAVVDAASRLQGFGCPVVFSGGLIQQFQPLREAILAELDAPDSRVFSGNDATLTGLARLAVKR